MENFIFLLQLSKIKCELTDSRSMIIKSNICKEVYSRAIERLLKIQKGRNLRRLTCKISQSIRDRMLFCQVVLLKAWIHCSALTLRSEEVFALERSAFESIYGAKLTLSIASAQLINFDKFSCFTTQTRRHTSFFRTLISKFKLLYVAQYMFLVEVVGEFDELSLN